ncbi:MAG: 4-hydroxythreonine-4-phosphate dehydrogenase PdxA [Dehalococcoidia bacterium]
MSGKPIIAITTGDPAGIGPEIVLKAMGAAEVYDVCLPLVIGAPAVLSWMATHLGLNIDIRSWSSCPEALWRAGTANVLSVGSLEPQHVAVGEVSASTGRAAMEYVSEAARLALSGEVAAIVTGPISKEAARLAGYPDMGHMEFFARITGVKRQATMLVADTLRVVHLSTHKSLREAYGFVTREGILDKVLLIYQCFRKWGFEQPRIGVAALNPHAGEGGLLGTEELEQIAPAVADARQLGIEVTGPIPADVIFSKAIAGEFDVVLAMYHDQGHIPIKTHNFERSVSVALGLPFVRASVDHGTAFDIAGKGVASPDSLIQAIKVASQLYEARRLSST